jgi:tellurite resistance protein TerC
VLHSVFPWVALVGALLAFLWADLKLFARGREPTFREGAAWSLAWLAISLLAALVLWPLQGGGDSVLYTTVYLIERSLSLDNLFVFLIIFAYFGVPTELRARALFWGIVAALGLRGAAIGAGVTAIERFDALLYVLGAALLVLAYRIFRGMGEAVEPDRNPMVRAVRRLFPVSGRFHGHRWFVRDHGKLHSTPLFLCLAAIVFADLAFAIDSIPAAFAITRDPFLIWMGNVFALLGLRALFVLVEGMIRRFRYLDQTIAIVLAVVAVKLLLEGVVEVGPVASLAAVAVLLGAGVVASLVADRRDPDAERKRSARAARTHPEPAEGPASDDAAKGAAAGAPR